MSSFSFSYNVFKCRLLLQVTYIIFSLTDSIEKMPDAVEQEIQKIPDTEYIMPQDLAEILKETHLTK